MTEGKTTEFKWEYVEDTVENLCGGVSCQRFGAKIQRPKRNNRYAAVAVLRTPIQY